MSSVARFSQPRVGHTAGVSAWEVDAERLSGLVRRIAGRDTAAFTELQALLAEPLLGHVRLSVPDEELAVAVATATFLEVWTLARMHTGPDTDVCAWITDIAGRRIADLELTRLADELWYQQVEVH